MAFAYLCPVYSLIPWDKGAEDNVLHRPESAVWFLWQLQTDTLISRSEGENKSRHFSNISIQRFPRGILFVYKMEIIHPGNHVSVKSIKNKMKQTGHKGEQEMKVSGCLQPKITSFSLMQPCWSIMEKLDDRHTRWQKRRLLFGNACWVIAKWWKNHSGDAGGVQKAWKRASLKCNTCTMDANPSFSFSHSQID